jgi:hypothetical protein
MTTEITASAKALGKLGDRARARWGKPKPKKRKLAA